MFIQWNNQVNPSDLTKQRVISGQRINLNHMHLFNSIQKLWIRDSRKELKKHLIQSLRNMKEDSKELNQKLQQDIEKEIFIIDCLLNSLILSSIWWIKTITIYCSIARVYSKEIYPPSSHIYSFSINL